MDGTSQQVPKTQAVEHGVAVPELNLAKVLESKEAAEVEAGRRHKLHKADAKNKQRTQLHEQRSNVEEPTKPELKQQH